MIEQQEIYYAYTGNGVTTQFAYGCRIFAATDLVVTVDGAVKALGVDYTITGVDDIGGGEITFVPAAVPGNGITVELERVLSYTRGTSYAQNGGFQPEIVDKDQDYQTALLQQLNTETRSLDSRQTSSELVMSSLENIIESNTTPIALTSQLYASAMVVVPGNYDSLEEARTAADAAGKTVVVLSSLTEAQSNISGPWPTDRALKAELCGSIANSTAFNIFSQFESGLHHVFVGAGLVSFSTLPPIIYPDWFGVIPDSGTDLANRMTLLNAAIAGRHGAMILFREGVYKTSVPYCVNGYGTKTIGTGRVVIEPPAGETNYVLIVGNPDPTNLSASIRLTADMTAGSYSATVTNVNGYEVGNVVYMFSGTSANSSGLNRIPLYKQFFHITAIDVVTNTLTFSAQAEVDFLVSDDAAVFTSTATPAVGGSIENIHFRNTLGASGNYLMAIAHAYMFELVNCRFDAYSAIGFIGFSDMVTHRNCELTGYSGYSTARGTKRATFENCTYNNGQLTQDVGAFFEETPELLYLNNCDIKSKIYVTSSSDPVPAKQFIMRNSKITAPGIALIFTGFYNTGGYGIDIDHCVFDAPGALTAASGNTRKGVVDGRFFNSIRVTNCEFKNAAADSYAIDAGNIGTIVSNLSGNRYGSSLGAYTSVVDNVNAPYVTGTFEPAITLGGAAVGVTYDATKTQGKYTRNGNIVNFTAVVVLTSKGSSAGTLLITGLPYTSQNINSSNITPVAVVTGTITTTITQAIQAYIFNNANTVGLFKVSLGASTQFTDADLTNTSFLAVSGQYAIP